jgi:catechol 2,3-dioxygenase
MRFYSGLDAKGDVTHHDLALAEVPPSNNGGAPEEWNLMSGRVGLNHVAIAWPDRESWLKQLAFLQSKGVPFLRRVNHGMTHSVYIADPDGHGIEVLYELPRAVWRGYRRRAELRRDAPDGGPSRSSIARRIPCSPYTTSAARA